MKERIGHIRMKNRTIFHGGNGEYDLNGYGFNDRTEGVLIIKSRLLCKFLCN